MLGGSLEIVPCEGGWRIENINGSLSVSVAERDISIGVFVFVVSFWLFASGGLFAFWVCVISMY
jgi:hypothetical protein